ncbi:MAG: helix-turn-helix transcriptional regulator [Lepagella sp.]
MKLYSFDEVLDEDLGKRGTPGRDAFEAQVGAEIHAYHIGEAIKQARKEKNLTQEQLGELMGVRRAQVSRIESGKNLNFSTIARAFKAMGIQANLAFGEVSLSLW